MLTHGGYPESEALHWTTDTQQQIGQIVFMMVSGDAKKVQQAYLDFHNLKDRFFTWEFDQFVDELNEYRVRKNFKSLTQMVREAREQIVKNGAVITADKQPEDILPEVKKVFEKIDSGAYEPPVERVEQMSLF
jgi:hypothetical protein